MATPGVFTVSLIVLLDFLSQKMTWFPLLVTWSYLVLGYFGQYSKGNEFGYLALSVNYFSQLIILKIYFWLSCFFQDQLKSSPYSLSKSPQSLGRRAEQQWHWTSPPQHDTLKMRLILCVIQLLLIYKLSCVWNQSIRYWISWAYCCWSRFIVRDWIFVEICLV